MNIKFYPLLLLSLPVSAQFRYAPEKPQLGQPVSFTYTPKNTPLATDSTIEGRYIRYGAPAVMPQSRPANITLVRQGNDFVGTLQLPKKDLAGVMMLFRNSQQPRRTDLNKGQLYVIPVTDETGKLVPHAIAGQASVFTRTGFLYEVGSRPDPNQVVSLYEQELKANPDLRPVYWSDHLAALVRQKKSGYGPKVKTAIESYLASRPAPTAAELTAAAQLYESMGDFAKANVQRERMKTLDPAGSLVQKDRATAIRNQADWTKRKALYKAFVTEFPASTHLPLLATAMADGYFKNNDIAGLITFVDQQPPAHLDVLMLNTMAFQLADEKRSLPEAEKLANKAIAVLKTQPKPGNVTGNWAEEKQIRERLLMNTLARSLEQQGKHAEAYTAYQAFINPDDVDNSDPRVNERYYLCALRTNHATEAQPMAEAAVEVGKATPRLKAALRDWYAKQPGQNEAKATEYLANLEAELRAEQREELKGILINEPAPAFSMVDLQGRTISSAALKGKVVVVDFWATWCGPCIASFPAMQQAQTRFQNDPNVRFLFVNTREGGPVQRVHNFMARNTYPFVVPLDAQQRMANAYKVQGIPTKVVIDGKGRVRYRAIGYNGNPEATVNELTMVVEMLKEGN
ncbi:TlpA disulfide reductase family protein [Spirosoma rigui]|uniref:TlpA disulfide reductase family protein n=1 Tax=Spirosoma rigui TaxID=564064 RepID=UPI0009B0C897|nr:TlpA disulfide reductase family protein [Spirosoma rigui]